MCKADSQSTLSILDPHDKADLKMTLNEDKIRHIIRVLRKEIGLLLAGFDVVIDNESGNHAVIDINVFPSYDNFPNFFEHLLDCIDQLVSRSNRCELNIGDCNGVREDDCVNSLTKKGLINVAVGPNFGVTGMNVV